MVRLLSVVAFAALPVLSLAGPLEQLTALQEAGNSIARKVLSTVFRFNDTQVERVMTTKAALPPHDFAVDITDKNWESVLSTGTDNPFDPPLPEDTVWVISVYGADQISKLFMTASDAVAQFNSSGAGGTLPKNLRFGRINYATETVLPTRWWMWKVPVLVIGTNGMKDLRFFKIGQVVPFHGPMSQLLANANRYETMPVWASSFGPRGEREWILIPIANGWAKYHEYMSKIPNFVLLMLSGVVMNVVVGWFHKDKPATTVPVPTDDERRAVIRARLAKEKVEVAQAAVSLPTPDAPTVEGSTAVKTAKGKATKRK